MPELLPDRNIRARRRWTANDHFKAAWETRLGWCTFASVFAHLLVLLWSPRFELPDRLVQNPSGFDANWIALVAGSSARGGALAFVAAQDGESRAESGAAAEAESRGPQADAAGGTEELWERLGQGGLPQPALIEPEPLAEIRIRTDRVASQDGIPRSIGLGASETDRLAGPDVELGRLAAIRPELSLLSPGSWILILNPAEVANFLENRFRPAALGNAAAGSLSVAIWIDERGSVEWAEINESSGRPDVDEAALQLFNEVVAFQPARERGVRVPVAAIFHLTYPWPAR